MGYVKRQLEDDVYAFRNLVRKEGIHIARWKFANTYPKPKYYLEHVEYTAKQWRLI